MKFVNARELDKKSGCTLGRTWGTRPNPSNAAMAEAVPFVQSLSEACEGRTLHGRCRLFALSFSQSIR
jgi:hypothetical protein